jgi:hypothetical protein
MIVPIHEKTSSPFGKAEIPLSPDIMSVRSSCCNLQGNEKLVTHLICEAIHEISLTVCWLTDV